MLQETGTFERLWLCISWYDPYIEVNAMGKECVLLLNRAINGSAAR